jgi:type IV secretion system protein VirD4
MSTEVRLSLHGTAEWLSREKADAAGLFTAGGVLLGQTPKGELVSFSGDGHLLVFAPNGAGKGIGFVQPNLVEYRGSMVVLDPKGENAIMSARRREELGQRVVVLDPFGQTGKPSQSYNPLASLNLNDKKHVMAELGNFAEALVPSRGSDNEAHWINGARMFVQGILLFMLVHEPPERRHLLRLHELAHAAPSTLDRLFKALAEGLDPDEEVQRVSTAYGHWWEGKNDREFSSFRSIALQELHWLEDFVWPDVLQGWNERLDLKSRPTTVYLVLPFSRLQRYRNWLRLMVADLTSGVLNVPGQPVDLEGKKAPPVLFMLDEAYAGLGRMDLILSAAATIRDAGGRIALVYQDLAQLKSLYEKDWESFLANSGAALFWSVNDLEGMEYVSKRCGVTTVPVVDNLNGHSRQLRFPDEVGAEAPNVMFCLLRSLRVARLTRLDAWHDKARFGRCLDENPRHKEVAARAAGSPSPRAHVPVDLGAAGKTPEEKEEAALLEKLSAQFGQKVFKNAGGTIGFLDSNGFFQEIYRERN